MNLCDAGVHKVIQELDNCADLYCESNRRYCIIPDNHFSAVVVFFLLVRVYVRRVRYFEALLSRSFRYGEEEQDKD